MVVEILQAQAALEGYKGPSAEAGALNGNTRHFHPLFRTDVGEGKIYRRGLDGHGECLKSGFEFLGSSKSD